MIDPISLSREQKSVMSAILRRLVAANVFLSNSFVALFHFPPRRRVIGELPQLRDLFKEAQRVADVGGGKKPWVATANLDVGERRYVGLDIDSDELAAAPSGCYTEAHAIDMTCPPPHFHGASISSFVAAHSNMFRMSGRRSQVLRKFWRPMVALTLNCPADAPFFNLVFPNKLKRWIMHRVFSHKSGDGFRVFYDSCTPSEICKAAHPLRLNLLGEARHYRSTYFTFFFPLYLLWRMVTILQYLFDKNYCESFGLVLTKIDAG